MTTPFDLLTIACFIGLMMAFFRLTEGDLRTLLHMLPSGFAFAVANQVGNAGATLLALVLMGAGCGYVALVIRGY